MGSISAAPEATAAPPDDPMSDAPSAGEHKADGAGGEDEGGGGAEGTSADPLDDDPFACLGPSAGLSDIDALLHPRPSSNRGKIPVTAVRVPAKRRETTSVPKRHAKMRRSAREIEEDGRAPIVRPPPPGGFEWKVVESLEPGRPQAVVKKMAAAAPRMPAAPPRMPAADAPRAGANGEPSVPAAALSEVKPVAAA